MFSASANIDLSGDYKVYGTTLGGIVPVNGESNFKIGLSGLKVSAAAYFSIGDEGV